MPAFSLLGDQSFVLSTLLKGKKSDDCFYCKFYLLFELS